MINKTEQQQIKLISDNMEAQIETVLESSSYLSTDNWIDYEEEMQNVLNDWRLNTGETLYIISKGDVPVILASTSKQYSKIIGQNALSSKYIDPMLILNAYNGEKEPKEVEDLNEKITNLHLAYPVISELGQIKGIIYMTSSLSSVYTTIDNFKIVLINATVLALAITVVLGFIIASSITNPIKDLTEKAEKMARGDFDQFVDIKSNDEIGQLGTMFNYLTLELKNRIEEIDLEKSKLETIFTYMAEGVIAVNNDNEIIHANLIAQDLLNLKYNYLEEKTHLNFDELGIKGINFEDEDTLKGNHILSLSGEVYKVKHAPYRNKADSENNIGIIMVFQDITKEHELDNLRREFIANVSHELKTPITTIKSYTETLIESDVDKDTTDRFLSVINTEADRMNRLVMDLLKLSNLDSNKTDWDKSYVDVNKLIEDAIFKLEYSIKDKSQIIKVNLSKDSPYLNVDRDGLEQVILNIVSNAIKYNDYNGLIEVTTENEEDYVKIKVVDNGPGISAEDLPRIFERFYRVEKGRSRDLGGTGLGLSIAKEIVEAHGGSLVMNSALKEGTSVDIILPKV